MFDSEIPLMDMLFRLLAAAGLALLLALERELRGKAAGLRSHMLVSLGASAFIMMGIHILFATAEGDPSAPRGSLRVSSAASVFWVLAALFRAVAVFRVLPLVHPSGQRAQLALRAASATSPWPAWSRRWR